MKGFEQSIEQNWTAAWQDSRFRWQLILAIAVFAIFPWKADDYFQWIQQREGIVMQDIVLANIPAKNVSIPIFAIIYFSVVYLIARIIRQPKHFLWFAWAFNVETIMRFASIYWVALNPPEGLVDLHDPIAELFIYGENLAITKDLFFSGHTATMVFVCYFLPQAKERKIAIALTSVLVILLLIQHVHYSLDIVAAPIATWVAIRIAKALLR
ncbi:phosphatase PAP2-related protein [Aquirufa regiilacus]|uniref:Phosphatase PAP2-related protein n=1 Tax=Aquirufa regiilacus TaxID=3024868 RepID=A0ABU3TSE8_9BACT|nr:MULTISPECIES: phosphatase PAP2-related protein [unclassified Aquirufa]MDT8886454.1 phosphatase PAP2-related protein [Aquirufa sp. LEPPI-3A]MDU0808784.1 phosphatase PAP2-related protein [Aquirufa sp. LEOWEIH-7C]